MIITINLYIMKKLIFLVLVGIGLCLTVISCSDDDGNINPDPEPVPVLPNHIVAIVENWNDFGFNLLKEAANSSEFGNTNFLISPMGVVQTYSMLANGAGDEMRKNIVAVLGYKDLDIKQVNELNKKFMGFVKKEDDSAVRYFANSVWTTTDIPVANDFCSAADIYYHTEIKEIGNQTFVADINAWCNRSTDGNIDTFIKDFEPVPDISVGNIVYFTGKWSVADKFDATKIEEGYFRDDNGNNSPVKFLKNKKNMRYYETATMQKCALEFEGHSFMAAFILPKEGVILSQAIDALVDGGWKQICYGLNEVVVDLSLPKFRVESEIDLEKLVSDFSVADIMGASSRDCVTIAKQKNVFELTEQKAQSWPGYIPDIKTSSDKEVTMTFDRPFIYVVYEQSTGAILFAGCVNTFAD